MTKEELKDEVRRLRPTGDGLITGSLIKQTLIKIIDNSGSNVEVVDNLNTNDGTKALSARQGLILDEKKLEKPVVPGAEENIPMFDEYGELQDSGVGITDIVTKPTEGTEGNIVEFGANKSLKDSGKKISDFTAKDGLYPDMVSGSAMGVFKDINRIFYDSVIKRSAGKSPSFIQKIYGKTLAWNQLIQNGNFASVSWWDKLNANYTVSNNEASITKATNNSIGCLYKLPNALNIQLNHKYYLAGTLKTNSERNCYIGFFNPSTGTFLSNSIAIFNKTTYERKSVVFEYTDTAYRLAVRLNNADTTSDTIYAKNVILIDLTQIFGIGNEPATAAEFEAMFSLPYYNYTSDKLINNRAKELITTGFNQWDEIVETGMIDGVTGNNVSASNRWRSKSYIPVLPNTDYCFYNTMWSGTNVVYIFAYDSEKNYIGCYSAGNWIKAANYIRTTTIITMPSKARYIRIQNYTGSSYQNNICINLSNIAKNGTYEPHSAENTLQLNLTTLTGKLNGEGSSEVVMPDGLRSFDTTIDEGVIENGYLTQIVKRIGSRAYQSGDESDASVQTDLTTTHYILDTPQVFILDTPVYVGYKVNEYGTEKVVSSESQDSAPSAPAGFLISYTKEVFSKTSFDNFKNEFATKLGAALGQTIDIAETYNPDTGDYDYTVTISSARSLSTGTSPSPQNSNEEPLVEEDNNR